MKKEETEKNVPLKFPKEFSFPSPAKFKTTLGTRVTSYNFVDRRPGDPELEILELGEEEETSAPVQPDLEAQAAEAARISREKSRKEAEIQAEYNRAREEYGEYIEKAANKIRLTAAENDLVDQLEQKIVRLRKELDNLKS